jgi:hypothetical protein
VTDPAFVPGLDLARAFYAEVVRPLLDTHAPGVAHTAALVGTGSEVLGFDTERSTDHDWGPRLLLLLTPADLAGRADALNSMFGRELPLRFRGHPTGFTPPGPDRSRTPDTSDRRPVAHRIEVDTPGNWFMRHLGFDPRGEVRLTDWLVTPSQLLLEVTRGAVFHDGLGDVEPARRALAWYPHDLWLYLLAAQWRRIEQEEAFVGRCAEVGDDLGARLVAARLGRDLMRLCFLMERQYAPYSKWLGSAFAGLDAAATLGPMLHEVLAAADHRERQAVLASAYELTASRFNDLGITEAVDPSVRGFHDRPYRVLGAERFARAAAAAITDEQVRALPPGLGAIDQWVDSTDVTSNVGRAVRTASMYGR